MPETKTLLAMIVAATTAVCATGASAETGLTKVAGADDRKVSEACFNKVSHSASAGALDGRLVTGQPTAAQQTNASKATPAEIANLHVYHRDLTTCRQITLQTAGRQDPLLVGAMAEGYARQDAVLVGLVEGRLTWGEFARDGYAAETDSAAQQASAAVVIGLGLDRSDTAQLARREQAAVSLAAWTQNQQAIFMQQQMVNGLSQPRMTNCRYIGTQLSCSTF